MTDFARLVLDADTRGLKQGERDLKGIERQSAQTAREVDGGATRMASAFKRVGVALVAAGIGTVLYDFGKQSVQAAIDAEEMGSAFNVVFGDMAQDVRAWAEETGNALGRSTQEIQRGALAFQELFGKALDPMQAAELSKQFAVLTQDLASFKNLSNEVAQQKLFSGLVGEAEPLRAVGVFLSETAVQAKAAELGLAGVNGVLTDQEKIVARAAIIQDQLAQASGDVIRTSDSAANQIKTMNAAVEELQVAIGQKLLPQLTPLITLTADVVTVVAEAAAAMNVGTNSTKDFANGLRVIGEWVGRAAGAFQSLGNWLGWANSQMEAAYKRAIAVAGPIAQVVSLIERLGAARAREDKMASLGLRATGGNFSTSFIAGELAALGKSAAVVNAPSALPTVAANLGKIGGAARTASVSLSAAKDDFADLMESLFPENITRRQMQQLDQIEKYASRISNPFEARLRALGVAGESSVSQGLLNQGPLEEARKVQDAAKEIIGKSLEELQGKAEITTVRISETFAQMSQRITSSLQNLSNSIRSGDFLGSLGGVLDVFTQLGSAGVFGSGLQSRLNTPVAGARANGGMVSSGRSYLVGERGPELFTPGGTGFITPRAANDSSVHVTVGVDPRNGNLIAFVNGQIQTAAPGIAQGGAQLAAAQGARMQRRRVR